MITDHQIYFCLTFHACIEQSYIFPDNGNILGDRNYILTILDESKPQYQYHVHAKIYLRAVAYRG